MAPRTAVVEGRLRRCHHFGGQQSDGSRCCLAGSITPARIPWQEAAYCDPGLVRSARGCLMAPVAAHPPRSRAQVAEVVVPLLSCAAFACHCHGQIAEPSSCLQCAGCSSLSSCASGRLRSHNCPCPHTMLTRACLLRSTILDSGNRALCLKPSLCRIAHTCHVCVAQTTAR